MKLKNLKYLIASLLLFAMSACATSSKEAEQNSLPLQPRKTENQASLTRMTLHAALTELNHTSNALTLGLNPSRRLGKIGILGGVKKAKWVCAQLGIAEGSANAALGSFHEMRAKNEQILRAESAIDSHLQNLTKKISDGIEKYCAVSDGDTKVVTSLATDSRNLSEQIISEIKNVQ